MEPHIIGAMIIKLTTQGGWSIERLAQELNCTTDLLYRYAKGKLPTRKHAQEIGYRLAEIYCATSFTDQTTG